MLQYLLLLCCIISTYIEFLHLYTYMFILLLLLLFYRVLLLFKWFIINVFITSCLYYFVLFYLFVAEEI